MSTAWGQPALELRDVSSTPSLEASPLQAIQQHETHAALPEALRGARDLENRNNFVEAERRLRAYLQTDERSSEAHELLAYALLRQNKPAEALKEFQRSAALRSPSSTLLVHVGQAYVLLGDEPDADVWTLRAVQKNTSDPDAWYSLGRIRYSEQRFTDARSCFEHVLKLVPHSIKAENNLGLAYEALNQQESAMVAYRQAITWQRAGPPADQSDQPLLNLGTMLVHHGNLDEASSLLTEASSLQPNNAQVHEQLGHVALQRTDYAAARREFAKASALEPNNAAFHFLLGQALKHLDQKSDAQAEFRIAEHLTNSVPTQNRRQMAEPLHQP